MAQFTAKPADGVAWITGASTGIGAETALRLAGEGFTVYASARSEEKLKLVVERANGRGKIIPLPLDVTDKDACREAVQTIDNFGRPIALAMMNAGAFFPLKGTELTVENFEDTYAVNFFGVVNCLVPVLEVMKNAGQGQIALVASVSGYGGLKLASSYGSSKAAVINLAESLKFDFERSNIKIQIVNPGFVDTPLTKNNKFPMPFLMPLDKAADRLVACLKKDMFEITFPRRFTWLLKIANLLPYGLYFPLVGWATSGGKRSRS